MGMMVHILQLSPLEGSGSFTLEIIQTKNEERFWEVTEVARYRTHSQMSVNGEGFQTYSSD